MKLLLCLLTFLSLNVSAQVDAKKVAKFGKDVIYKYDTGSNLRVLKRWEGNVNIYLKTEAVDHELTKFVDYIDTTIKDINMALNGSEVTLTSKGAEEYEAKQSITVLIGDKRYIRKMAREYEVSSKLFTSTRNYPKSDRKLTSVIMIDTEIYIDDKIHRTILRGFLSAMGMPENSSEVPESVLHPNNNKLTKLSAFDRDFIRFFHMKLKSGMKFREVQKVIREFWDK